MAWLEGNYRAPDGPDPLGFDSKNGWGMWIKWEGYEDEGGVPLTKEVAIELCTAEDNKNEYLDHRNFIPRQYFEEAGYKCLDCLSPL